MVRGFGRIATSDGNRDVNVRFGGPTFSRADIEDETQKASRTRTLRTDVWYLRVVELRQRPMSGAGEAAFDSEAQI